MVSDEDVTRFLDNERARRAQRKGVWSEDFQRISRKLRREKRSSWVLLPKSGHKKILVCCKKKKKKKEFMSSHLSKPFVKVPTAISQRIFKDSLSLTTRNFRSTRYFCIKIRISKYYSICIKPCFQSLPCLFIVDIIKRKLHVSLKIWILWSFLWSCCQNNRTAWSQRYIIQYLQQQQSLLCSWYKKCKDIKRK